MPLGLKSLLLSLNKDLMPLLERLPWNLTSTTITASSRETLLPLPCTPLSPPDSLSSSLPGPLSVTIDLPPTMPEPPPGTFFSYPSLPFSRSADLEVLGRLQAYLAENVSTLEDYLMERVNTF